MSDVLITIEVAELDGWTKEHPGLPLNPVHWFKEFPDRKRIVDDAKNLPNYTASYDAIIPVIQKQPIEVRTRMTPRSFMSTPKELCIALIKAVKQQ